MNHKACLVLTLTLCCNVFSGEFISRPKIISEHGNLIISAGFDRNITLKINGPKSYINLQNGNEARLLSAPAISTRNHKEASDVIEDDRVPEILALMNGHQDILKRLNSLEIKTQNDSRSWSYKPLSSNIQSKLQKEIAEIKNLLIKDDCLSSPCHNGGECQDLYDGFKCRCTPNWTGKNCDEDVDECTRLAGTGLGCQNGATCINAPGSYQCQCSPGWYGQHCIRKDLNCSGHDNEICGHGVCSPVNAGLEMKCFCDQGWTTDEVHPARACVVDIDECREKKTPCSINPPVRCVNLQGSYTCGNCPMGYEGDGYSCRDIDECQMNNGGCSMIPNVQCTNTVGSMMCGPCPPGYQGDGSSCSLLKTPHYNDPPTGQCQPNACGVHGTCQMTPRGYTCDCQDGYEGSDCSKLKDVCEDVPCKNGGLCIKDNSTKSGYRCECEAQYTGAQCQEPAQACRNFHNTPEGHIDYPVSNSSSYNHNVRCSWVIQTSPDKVLNVTFTRFDLENSTHCHNDWLEIYDGRNVGSYSLGRYCGNILPDGGNIISSHDSLYFWFTSDHSVAGNGFSLRWNSIDPFCGGIVNVLSHGAIQSPGFPVLYPPNRDCYWTLTANPGKRIQLHFTSVELEAHPSCSLDYIEISDGLPSDPILKKYCNPIQPPPFTSPGPSLAIHFHSNAHNNGRGFQISYAVTEGTPGCGGLYTTEKGELTSPSIHYQDLNCEYIIQVPIGNVIKIEFLKFELEEDDFLSVYDGGSIDSKLVANYTETEIPHPYTSSSNEMLLLFKTGWSFGHSGFGIKYETVCYKKYTEEQGVITSPGFPGTYQREDSYKTCEYLVQVPPGKALELRFTDLHINGFEEENNCLYQIVTIYDGDSDKSPELGTYCYSTNIDSTIVSTHNYIYIELVALGNNLIFSINYNTIDAYCGGHFRDHSGNITFPAPQSLDMDYDDVQLTNCTWIISAPIGYVIHLTWRNFDVRSSNSCQSVSVKLYDINSETEAKQLIGNYCNNNVPPTTVTSTSNRFIIAYDVTSNETMFGDGFQLNYIFLNTESLCNGDFISSHGELKSPAWPKPYPHNTDCEWTITLPLEQQILIHFEYFNLDNDTRCKHDWLEIRNGLNKRATVLGKYCGSTIPKVITTWGNALRIHYKSDHYSEDKGFVMEWSETVTGCGASLTGPEGSLASPNYPDAYGKNSECYWRITTSAGSAIEIKFTDLDLDEDAECKQHYIEFYDGRDNSARKIGRYCSIKSTAEILSSSNHVYVKYRSVTNKERRGFALDYKTVCNRTISGFSGVIESPDPNHNYPKLLNCTWNIIVPKGSIIDVTFIDFDVERHNGTLRPENKDHSHIPCSEDYLVLRDALNTNHAVSLCGEEIPDDFATKSNELEIKFITNSDHAYSSFKLEWVVNGCAGVLRQPQGEFSPTPFKGEDSRDEECHWKIIANPGTSIELTISEVHLDAYPGCHNQYIILYNGPTEESHVLSKICHNNEKDITVTSSSNYMYVVFKANSYLNHASASNFTAKYRQIANKCGGKFSGHNGNIISPNYPNNYDKNLNCFWTIEVDENHLIELNFVDFDIIDNKGICTDFVKIYDGVDPAEGGTNVTRYCGSKDPLSLNFTSKTNRITVQLKTDDENIKSKGFKLNYHIACGARITTDGEGFLNSNPAMNDEEYNDCTWTILAKELNQRVHVTFRQMNLRSGAGIDHCRYDYINVFDGDDVDAPLIGKYCHTPPMIVSEGSAITIQLGSHLWLVYGRFSAHYSVLSTACGGIISSSSGSLTSPNYPDTYPLNADCEWILNTSPGNKVSISFEKLDIESSEHCNEDYIEIRENGEAGPILGVFCNSKIPAEIVGSQVYIKFHSDHEGTAPGFILHFSYLHDNDITGLSQGQISSPLYPKPFSSGDEYSWRVTTKSQTVIDITIQEFDVCAFGGHCFCYLAIYDGFNDEAPVLFKECGSKIPSDTFRSTYNTLYIKFKFIPSRESKFFLEWREISKTNLTNVENTICNSVNTIHISKGTRFELTSPGYPDKYDDDIKCEWIFSTDEGSHLSIIFSEIDLYQSLDCILNRINVFERSNGKWKALSGNMCFLNTTESKKIDINGEMKVTFVSSINEFEKKGFSAVVKSECGGHFTSPSTIIEPSTSDTDCIWTVRVRLQRTIHVDVQVSDDDPDTDRCDRYLILRDGSMADSPVLGKNKYCNQQDFNSSGLSTTTNWLYVKYFSHYIDIPAPFRIRYSEISQECGFRMTLSDEMSSTTISSPNYPNTPLPNSECIWIILAPAGEILQLDVVDRFDLTVDSACSKEMLEIRDGGTRKSELIGVFCRETPSTQKTTDNMLFVRYITNIDEPKNGFKAKITIGKCGGTLREEGSFSSPGYPAMSNLPPGTLCEWRLIGLPHGALVIDFLNFNLPPSKILCGTNLAVYEIMPTNDTRVPLSGLLCNHSHNPASITSLSNEVEVRFQIGDAPHSSPPHDDTHTGFSIKFTSTYSHCHYTLNEPSGYLQSTVYPNWSELEQSCDWEITVPSGRRVTLQILDIDRERYSLHIYEGVYRHELAVTADDNPILVKASDNQMFITYHGRRGFRANYTSDEPTVCLGSLSQSKGTLYLPAEDNFLCKWARTASEDSFISNTTILLSFSNLTMTGESALPCDESYYDSHIVIKDDENDISFELCGSYASDNIKVRYPDIEILLIVERISANSLSFVLDYTVQPCGGVMEFKEGFSRIHLPTNHAGSLDCAWHFKNPDSLGINITIEGRLNSNCDEEYFKISDLDSSMDERFNESRKIKGFRRFMEIRKYCKDKMSRRSLKLNLENFLVEYHTDLFSNDSNLTLNLFTEREGCGGQLTDRYSQSFASPNFPKSYDSNEECIWDIEVNIGHRIRLTFEKRFDVEKTHDCHKDYVQVYDFKNDEYIANPKLCGRITPEQVDSTDNRMRVVFRSSNDSVVANGFQASWTTHCGGSYQAMEEEQWLHSPVYDWDFDDFDECIYHISAKSEYIRINFIQSKLEERENIDCTEHSITVVENNNSQHKRTYCGKDLPPTQRFNNGVTMTFSKSWHINFDYNFTFAIDHCNKEITKAGLYSSPRNKEGTYDGGLDCRWNINADDGKIIILHFLYFSIRCFHYASVTVYDGIALDDNHRRDLPCGSYNHSLPAYISVKNEMVIRFETHAEGEAGYGGFDVNIVFMYNEKSGCGGKKELPVNASFQITSPLVRKQEQYVPFLDCHTIIEADPDQVLSVSFQKIQIAPCNSNMTALNDTCKCDFVELRDGDSSNADLLGRYCQSRLPPVMKTSTKYLYVRFVSDASIEDLGYEATVTAIYSECGKRNFEPTQALQRIVAPRDEQGAILRSLNCKYEIYGDRHEMLRIHFKTIDLEPPENNTCRGDRIMISNVFSSSEEVFDYRERIGQSSMSTPGHGYTICGSMNNFTFLYYEKMYLQVKTSPNALSQHYSGYELEMSTAKTCDMVYKDPQNRITIGYALFETCTFLIEAPRNYTISLYFKFGSVGTHSFVKVFDGNSTESSSDLLLDYDLSSDIKPDAVFSTGRYMLIRMTKEHFSGMHIDMYYVTTSEGRGCGGRLQSYDGVFTSPMYPAPYRKQAVCEWVVETPPGTRLELQFPKFDLGHRQLCQQNYLTLISRAGQQVASYCADDEPADHISEDNYMKVIFHISVNGDGPGWKAIFSSSHSDPVVEQYYFARYVTRGVQNALRSHIVTTDITSLNHCLCLQPSNIRSSCDVIVTSAGRFTVVTCALNVKGCAMPYLVLLYHE